jgi:tetratricopeptide (TPR) repeat protein
MNDKDVLKLLDLLTNLPLAIKQAAAFLNENSMSISEYVRIYQSSDEELIELLSENFEDHGRYSDIKNPVAFTWLISFQHIQQSDKIAAEYLYFMSCLAQQDIPRSLLPPASKIEEGKAIGTLIAFAFVTERSKYRSYDMHRLVQLVVRNWLKKKGKLSFWTSKALERVATAFPFFEHKKKDQCMSLLPHTQYVLKFQRETTDSSESLRDLLFNVGEYFQQTGKYKEAETMHRRTLELREKVLGLEHPSTLTSMNNLASVLDSQGKYEEAETMHRQELELTEKVLGLEHPSTLTSMNNLASVLKSQGEYEEAETMHRRTLELKEKVLGLEHPSTLTSMNNLALVLKSQGKYKEAETMHRRTLELREKMLGLEHPDTLTSMNNLALVLKSQGKYKEAKTMHRRTLELKEKVLGLEHPSTLTSMNNLALVLDSQGEYEEAETMRQTNIEDFITKDSEDASGQNEIVPFQQKSEFLPLTPLPRTLKPAHLALSQRRIPPEKPPKPAHLK